MADFSIKAHDQLPSIRAELTIAATKAPVDLSTAANIRFIMTTAVGAVTKVASPAVLENAAAGIVRYDWQAIDTDLPGKYLAEWEVTWAGGKKQTFPTGSYHTVEVLADLDGA